MIPETNKVEKVILYTVPALALSWHFLHLYTNILDIKEELPPMVLCRNANLRHMKILWKTNGGGGSDLFGFAKRFLQIMCEMRSSKRPIN